MILSEKLIEQQSGGKKIKVSPLATARVELFLDLGNVMSFKEFGFNSIDEIDTFIRKYNHLDSGSRRAPILIGETKRDALAHGWVLELHRHDHGIYAKIEAISKEFNKQIIMKKSEKTVIISLYPDKRLRCINLLDIPRNVRLPDYEEYYDAEGKR